MHIIKLTQKSIVQENILKIMNTLHLLCFLLFLALPIRLASKQYSGSFNEDYNGPFKVQETDEEDEFDEFLNLPNWESGGRKKDVSNVDAFGAVGDGVSDDTKVIDKAFVGAWKKACSKRGNSIFLVPKGKKYLIDGTIVAPDDPKVWDPDHPRMWLGYYNLSNVFFQGKGVIDGSGSKWWAASCKRNKSNPCIGAPTALTIDSSSRVRVRDLTVQNGQQMHFTIARSEIVRVSGVTVLAPGNSPNTDGIHVTTSKNVVLHNCVIGTGDDCISIVSHSSNIKMKNIYCGPGHGISIGSLGKNNSIGQVETVVLDNAFIRDTTNGLRIKTWQGGSGYVRAVRYENVKMENVSNPIIIDQFYCDSPTKCEDQASAVEVSEILYKNITGTSATRIAMKFACSETVPCSKIVLNNINLQSESEDGDEETYCNNASGSVHGHVHPSADCLLQNSEEEKSYEHNIRTEL
ncbi:probable polygalacturonase At1g80170 isoform X3 [Salvia hispanica]|uniref:probable polygalacturonase At1g80170 isoform X3 n=1 Tax=Salvia hispanica TaxID=49212 RepID=UPI0020098998|nr:probable polygalacturonase At1g80170 isoform X3 [Salvia hispanica]XP_047963902.1 probable polygalacturonase At1g80170 isoform X3 [Salvia hispanica]